MQSRMVSVRITPSSTTRRKAFRPQLDRTIAQTHTRPLVRQANALRNTTILIRLTLHDDVFGTTRLVMRLLMNLQL